MSKSFLIINTPNNCWECPCFMDAGWRCQVRLDINEEVHDGRPEWCPLKNVPAKKEYSFNDVLTNSSYLRFADGFNKCIDEMIGEENENCN